MVRIAAEASLPVTFHGFGSSALGHRGKSPMVSEMIYWENNQLSMGKIMIFMGFHGIY